MGNKFFLSDSGHIKEVSSNHSEIKDQKNKDLFHYGLSNEGDNIVFLDKDRKLAKPLVKSLMSASFKREKKFFLLSIFFMVCFMFSLIFGLVKPSVAISQTKTIESVPIVQTEEIQPIDIGSNRIQELNTELAEDYRNLKIDLSNTEEQNKMHISSINNLSLENKSLKNKLGIEEKRIRSNILGEIENSKFEMYKSIEKEFYDKKQSEYKKIWYNENIKAISKQCKEAYFSTKKKYEQNTINNG